MKPIIRYNRGYKEDWLALLLMIISVLLMGWTLYDMIGQPYLYEFGIP